MARLASSCARLSLTMPSEEVLRREALALAAGQERAVLKIIVTRGPGGRGYAPAGADGTRLLALWPWPAHAHGAAREGADLRWCRLRLACQPALAGMKHLNRLEQVLARAEWDHDPHEGLLCDMGGAVISGTMSNLFALVRGVLWTPDLSQSGVAGVLRARVLEVAARCGLICRVATLPPDFVAGADEMFVTNSVIGLWPVRSLAGRAYPLGPITKEIQKRLAATRALVAPPR